MKIDIIAVGRIKESYLKDGIAEFAKRLKPYANLEIIECLEEKMPENAGQGEKDKVLAKEGEKLLQCLRGKPFVVALDLAGQRLSSEGLARFFNEKGLSGQSHLAFMIGGAYGLGRNARQRADMLLNFSDFTFTHQMIRLLLVEQIYRAFKIIKNEKYHN